MIKHIVKVKHYYQGMHNPDVQKIELDCDYATAYALFSVLIDKGKNFSVEIGNNKNV